MKTTDLVDVGNQSNWEDITKSDFHGHQKQNESNHTIVTVTKSLWLYGGITLVLLGLLGNIFSIIVLSRKRLRKSSWSLYLTVLAVSDIIILITTSLDWWFQTLTGKFFGDLSEPGCKIEAFATYFSTHYAAWIMAAVAGERIIFIYFPHHAKRLCTRTVARTTCGILGLIFTLCNLHFFWTIGIVCDGAFCYCYFIISFPEWSKIDLILSSVLPFFLIAICNALFIKRMMSLYSGPNTSRARRLKSTIVMMMSITIAFIFLTLPVAILIVIADSSSTYYQDTDPEINTAFSVAMFLHQFNSVINFGLYFLTNERFKNEVKCMLGLKITHLSRQSRLSYSTLSSFLRKRNSVVDMEAL
ncbi:unnamed protein product [Owenia fusiformis]|uniref:Uncharacterized protein n=1 Tax=Owenia fusiformis TaxID=6347 RepID=A0A8J1UE67_OWEFU|nr:unnamed protein product [Owenia fusiformis]